MVSLGPAPPAATVQHLQQCALLLLVEDGPGGESVVPYRRTAKKSESIHGANEGDGKVQGTAKSNISCKMLFNHPFRT